jgi:NitT/TauT family transport system substrate-binding protein
MIASGFRSAALFGALALGAMLLQPASAAEPFRLIVTDLEPPLVPNSVMDMAVQLGYFEKEGVDVELVRVQQTPSAIAALQAGEGEMANVSVDAVLQLVGRGQMDLKAVVSPNKALPFLIASKAEIADPAGLEGRSFGVGRVGSLDHTLSGKVLQAAGVDLSKVSFVSIGQPAVRAQALAAGQVDATTMSIGVWMALPDKAGLHVLVHQQQYYEAAPVVQKVNVVTDEVLASRRDDVAAVVRALIAISRDFAEDPEKWVDQMEKARPDTSRENLTELAKAFAESWSVNGGLNREELAFTVDWAYESPDLEGVRRVELSEWVDFSLVDEALAAAGTHPGFDEPGR